MAYKYCALLIFLVIVTSSCDVELENQRTFTATPGFVTATLPAAPRPLPTQTPPPPTPIPTITPIEGLTTAQINVRAETSTASENLGMIAQFSTVQVIGKDASGSWYQIIYTNSRIGWVRAEFVQVNASAQIPVIKSGTGNGSGLSGLVIQKINVRNGPGTTYDILGILNPNDVVFMTGKSPSGAWIQIEYTNTPDGKGWAASEFLKIEDAESLPVIEETGASQQMPTEIVGTPATIILPAMQDGDSMGAPLAKVTIAPGSTRAFQVNGDVSAPKGDAEDWVEFTSYNSLVVVQLLCSSNVLQVELWNRGAGSDDFLLTCGEERLLSISPNSTYLVRLFIPPSDELRYTSFTLRVEALR